MSTTSDRYCPDQPTPTRGFAISDLCREGYNQIITCVNDCRLAFRIRRLT